MFDKQTAKKSKKIISGSLCRRFIISDSFGLGLLIEDANATVKGTIDNVGNVGDGFDFANALEPFVGARFVAAQAKWALVEAVTRVLFVMSAEYVDLNRRSHSCDK